MLLTAITCCNVYYHCGVSLSQHQVDDRLFGQVWYGAQQLATQIIRVSVELDGTRQWWKCTIAPGCMRMKNLPALKLLASKDESLERWRNSIESLHAQLEFIDSGAGWIIIRQINQDDLTG